MKKSVLGFTALVVCLSFFSGSARGAETTCCTHSYECFTVGSPIECGINAFVVSSCDECVAPGAGAVPSAGDLPGAPLLLDKNPSGEIDLAWSASCVASDTDYAVYEGLLGDFTSHLPALDSVCTTAGSLTATIAPSAGNRYYLVVPQGEVREGFYGAQSGDLPRPPSVSACQPQLVEMCLPQP